MSQMTPTPAVKNTRYGGLPYTVGRSYFKLFVATASQLENFSNSAFVQFRCSVFCTIARSFSKYPIRVKFILARIAPFQIFKTIIAFSSIDVVALMLFFLLRSNKRRQHQFVDKPPTIFSWSMKFYTKITRWHQHWLEHFRRCSETVIAAPAFYSTEIAYFIETFITNHWTPFFGFGRLNNRHADLSSSRVDVQASTTTAIVCSPFFFYNK